MKRVVDILIRSSRIAVVVLAIAAIALSGAGSAHRLFTAPQPEVEDTPSISPSLDGKQDPREPSEEMAKGSRPWTEQPACIQAALAVPSGNDGSRQVSRLVFNFAVPVIGDHSIRSDAIFSTTGPVSSRIAHRFTLVGAKPSGTG